MWNIANLKSKKSEIKIIGYGIDLGHDERPYPIFNSEKGTYKGKIFATVQLAKESRK
jgi:hypothetical protein